MTAAMVPDGAVNADAFRAYIEQELVPTLTPGDMVIMDNLPAHKVVGIRESIKEVDAQLRYLPPFSPDFQSNRDGIFEAQSTSARKSRTNYRSSWDAVGQVGTLFEPTECANYFVVCGYEPT